LISSTEKFLELDYLYHQRNLKKPTLDIALDLILKFYEDYKDHPFTTLPAEELRALSITCESLDYFNRLNAFKWYVEGDYEDADKEHEIYVWLSESTDELKSSIPLDAGENLSEQDPLLLLCQVRLVAAVVLNEEYRLNRYSYGPSSDLGRLISFTENCLQPRLESDPQSLESYRDVMVNLHFLHGKAARQAGEFVEAERSFNKSSSYLLNLALSYCDVQEIEHQDLAECKTKLIQIRSKVKRIGVVDLARSWLYLAWGKIDKASLHIERAVQLLDEDDVVSRMLAQSIQGTVLRIKAGHDTRKLGEATRLLEKSYRAFFSGVIKVPRHTIRTLYELEIALILGEKIEKALGNIEEVVQKVNSTLTLEDLREEIYRRDFKKLVKDSSWQSKIHILCSRIARKDQGNVLKERLYNLLNRPSGIGESQSEEQIPLKSRSSDSRNLAIKFAQRAEKIAKDNNLRICEMDSLIALGEAYFHCKQYDKACATFKKCLDIIKAPHGQSAGKGIDGSDLCAVSYIYLARIAIKNRDQELAEEELQKYKQLPSVEHAWIRELAEVAQAEIHTLSERKIVIIYDDSVTWWAMLENFEAEAIKKRIMAPRKSGVKRQELLETLDICPKTYHNLVNKGEGDNS
jgi:tetratricopeptide (TPR) repeat protein